MLPSQPLGAAAFRTDRRGDRLPPPCRRWRVRDRRIAKIIRACQELPGQELLQYIDEQGNCQDVTSSDVNEYLKAITGKDITAKDFRPWAGTVLAAMTLSESRRTAAASGF